MVTGNGRLQDLVPRVRMRRIGSLWVCLKLCYTWTYYSYFTFLYCCFLCKLPEAYEFLFEHEMQNSLKDEVIEMMMYMSHNYRCFIMQVLRKNVLYFPFTLSVVWSGWRDKGNGWENDVWPAAERDGKANIWWTKEARCPSKVSHRKGKMLIWSSDLIFLTW